MLTRSDPFAPPDVLRDGDPIRRLTYADGHEGWLITSHRRSRDVLADPRFSVRQELLHSPFVQQSALQGVAGFFIRLDPPEHTRYRKLLTGQFTVRRMQQLETRIKEIVEDHLDAMPREADLVRDFALPVPSLVMCELLGVAYDDRARFQRASTTILDYEASVEARRAAMGDLLTYLRSLSAHKRQEPSDDILSGLTAELSDDEITGMALLLLIAGHETTANMLSLGMFLLLQRPDQITHMRTDPDAAVEELLRYLSVVYAITRTALEDVEIDGHLIEKGQSVTLSLATANRDATRFGLPDDVDLTRQAQGHLAFGHGVHQCLGQQLARIEMRIAFPALLNRFPGLELAVPPDEVVLKSASVVHGVRRLPVRW